MPGASVSGRRWWCAGKYSCLIATLRPSHSPRKIEPYTPAALITAALPLLPAPLLVATLLPLHPAAIMAGEDGFVGDAAAGDTRGVAGAGKGMAVALGIGRRTLHKRSSAANRSTPFESKPNKTAAGLKLAAFALANVGFEGDVVLDFVGDDCCVERAPVLALGLAMALVPACDIALASASAAACRVWNRQ